MSLRRPPQRRGEFVAGDPASGYYNDLTPEIRDYGTPSEALAWFELLTRRRERLAPLGVVQLGIGAWQLRDVDGRWLELVRRVAEWVVLDADGHGRLMYLFDMPHTYRLHEPWCSAIAQGQAASLLVRAAVAFDRPEFLVDARRVAAPLLDGELVAKTGDGPVLQEYPTDPASHVLNGWIFALWGLYDLTRAMPDDERVECAWIDGVTALAARLHRYDTGGWSRYDLYPHPVVHVASPFYHRLHVEQVGAMHELHPAPEFAEFAERWSRSLDSRARLALAVARKVGFRLLKPRVGRAA